MSPSALRDAYLAYRERSGSPVRGLPAYARDLSYWGKIVQHAESLGATPEQWFSFAASQFRADVLMPNMLLSGHLTQIWQGFTLQGVPEIYRTREQQWTADLQYQVGILSSIVERGRDGVQALRSGLLSFDPVFRCETLRGLGERPTPQLVAEAAEYEAEHRGWTAFLKRRKESKNGTDTDERPV